MNESDFDQYLTAMLTTLESLESLRGEHFWMDHIIAGQEYEGDYLYNGVENLPNVGSSVNGFYDDGDGSKPYIFRVVAVTFYEVEVTAPRHSKSIGAILIDPVMENPVKGTPAIAA
jgi:hypothetical protein